MNSDDWLKGHVAYLKGLKFLSEQQSVLVILAEKDGLTSSEDKKLRALVNAEKATQRAAKARQAAANLLNDEKRKQKEADRKARNHNLIQKGLLFEIAGLGDKSREELLGLLLAAAASANQDPARWTAWQTRGQSMLKENS